ncbi:hypothetical protein EMCRGX_G017887 [Ephydatia muelleri]
MVRESQIESARISAKGKKPAYTFKKKGNEWGQAEPVRHMTGVQAPCRAGLGPRVAQAILGCDQTCHYHDEVIESGWPSTAELTWVPRVTLSHPLVRPDMPHDAVVSGFGGWSARSPKGVTCH